MPHRPLRAPDGPPTDAVTGWALAAKLGDRQAATEFVTATRSDVRRFLAHLAAPADVDDLTQETYLRAMKALPRFAGTASARTWLLAIARRVAADHVRMLVRRPRTEATADVGESAAPRRFEDGVVLGQLIDRLPVQRRTAFVATQMLGLSYEEAAAVCDCPVGTIRSRVARAREDLVAAWRAGDDHPERGTRRLRAVPDPAVPDPAVPGPAVPDPAVPGPAMADPGV